MNTASTQVTRPGRPKSAEKRAAISRAAGELFLNEGFAGTSMEAVAARAGVSKQTVYSHYENKDALFCACIDQKCRDYRLAVDADDRADWTLRQWLEAIGERYLSLIADAEVIAMWRLLIAEAAEHPDIVRMFWDVGPRPTIEGIASMMEGRAGEGIVIDDPLEATQVFLALLRTDYHNRLLLDMVEPMNEGSRRRRASRAVDQLYRLYTPAGEVAASAD